MATAFGQKLASPPARLRKDLKYINVQRNNDSTLLILKEASPGHRNFNRDEFVLDVDDNFLFPTESKVHAVKD